MTVLEKFMCKLTFSGIEGKGLYTYVGLIYVATVVLNFLVATKIVGCAPAEPSRGAAAEAALPRKVVLVGRVTAVRVGKLRSSSTGRR